MLLAHKERHLFLHFQMPMPGKKNKKEIRDEEENQRHTDEHRRLGCLLGASEVDHPI